MARTKRFSLAKFGGDEGGSLSDDGFKFSSRDRDVIDAVLSAFESHTHVGGERLPNPTAAPGLSTLTEGGALAGGRTYFYRVSFIDRYGLETAASDETAIATPSPVQPPGPPILGSTVGGVLTDGVYEYALTAEAGDYETQLGMSAVIQLLPDRTAISLEMPGLPTGADAFGIWRKGPNAVGFTKIGSTTAPTILDDGSVPDDPCACDPDKLPPQENRTNASNIVTVTAPAFPPGTRGWRIYRTTSSGAYGSASLVAEVRELDDSGALVSHHVDEGNELLESGPLETSQTLVPSPDLAHAGDPNVLYLEAPDASVWRLTATRSGVIETRVTAVPATYAPVGIVLSDINDIPWRLTVGSDGVVATTQQGVVAGDMEFAAGEEPDLPTVDGAVSYKLTVGIDGALETHGTDDSTVVEGVGVRRIIASSTEPENPQVGDLWIEI